MIFGSEHSSQSDMSGFSLNKTFKTRFTAWLHALLTAVENVFSWKLVVDLVEKKYLVKTYIAYESLFHIMVHVKWPSPNIKVDLDHETDDFMKKRFYQRNLQPSKHPKRVGTKKFFSLY